MMQILRIAVKSSLNTWMSSFVKLDLILNIEVRNTSTTVDWEYNEDWDHF